VENRWPHSPVAAADVALRIRLLRGRRIICCSMHVPTRTFGPLFWWAAASGCTSPMAGASCTLVQARRGFGTRQRPLRDCCRRHISSASTASFRRICSVILPPARTKPTDTSCLSAWTTCGQIAPCARSPLVTATSIPTPRTGSAPPALLYGFRHASSDPYHHSVISTASFHIPKKWFPATSRLPTDSHVSSPTPLCCLPHRLLSGLSFPTANTRNAQPHGPVNSDSSTICRARYCCRTSPCNAFPSGPLPPQAPQKTKQPLKNQHQPLTRTRKHVQLQAQGSRRKGHLLGHGGYYTARLPAQWSDGEGHETHPTRRYTRKSHAHNTQTHQFHASSRLQTRKGPATEGWPTHSTPHHPLDPLVITRNAAAGANSQHPRPSTKGASPRTRKKTGPTPHYVGGYTKSAGGTTANTAGSQPQSSRGQLPHMLASQAATTIDTTMRKSTDTTHEPPKAGMAVCPRCHEDRSPHRTNNCNRQAQDPLGREVSETMNTTGKKAILRTPRRLASKRRAIPQIDRQECHREQAGSWDGRPAKPCP
jgi:hypothetical protein